MAGAGAVTAPCKGHGEEAHCYADDIQPPLSFSLSPSEGHLLTTEFRKEPSLK